MWTCHKCSHSFKYTSQSHSCNLVGLGTHLDKHTPEIVALFDCLISQIQEFGEFKIEAVKDAIMLRKSSAFVTIRIQKECLDISFKLDHHVEEFPVYKFLQLSRHRWFHALKIETEDEIDAQLLGWLKEAADLVKD